MRFPNTLKYTKDHEWAKSEGSVVIIGVTDHAQSSLGDIVFVELPKVGRELKTHETFGVVESIKAVSELYSPIAGKVVAVNDGVVSDPSSLNRDPHTSAWLMKIEPKDPAELAGLLDSDKYTAYIDSIK